MGRRASGEALGQTPVCGRRQPWLSDQAELRLLFASPTHAENLLEPFHRIDGPVQSLRGKTRSDEMGPGCRTFRPPSLSCTSSASNPPPHPIVAASPAPRPTQSRLVISNVIAGFVSGGKVTRHVSTIVCQRSLRLTAAAATCLEEANNPSFPCLCSCIIQSRTFERKEQIVKPP